VPRAAVRYYLRTFGCRANQYDTQTVAAMIRAGGGEIVASAAEADVAVFNSCAVTADAEADLRQSVRRAARERPALRSVIMGCASALPRSLPVLQALPGVDALVAGADYVALAAALALPAESASVIASAQTGARALLRVQDGCDEHCTFCATTLARGVNRSRSPELLVEEARALAERHPEIVLTGIHVGTYGADVGSSLGALLERLVREVPSVRFRLASVEATEVDDRLRELLTARDGRVAPYLHAPLQSGSDRVLKRMGRRWYTRASYAAAVRRLTADGGVFGLGADVIAGFPGETDADHRATLALLRALPFTSLHVFPYSVRPGTPAERLGGRVDGNTVRERAAELRALGAELARAHVDRRLGTPADVVVTGARDEREGLTEDYLTVAVSDATAARGERFAARLVPGPAAGDGPHPARARRLVAVPAGAR
jgi:threonylcarbamoyladenosine tRNA methylthiotransferase MtaB